MEAKTLQKFGDMYTGNTEFSLLRATWWSCQWQQRSLNLVVYQQIRRGYLSNTGKSTIPSFDSCGDPFFVLFCFVSFLSYCLARDKICRLLIERVNFFHFHMQRGNVSMDVILNLKVTSILVDAP